MIYDVNWFISFFSVIPKNQWCTFHLRNGEQKCATAHLEDKITEDTYVQTGDLVLKLRKIFLPKFGVGVAAINDGKYPEFGIVQDHPKDRILFALSLCQ